MNSTSAYFLLDVPFAISKPVEQIISRATEAGRNAGLDCDWVPKNLEEAAYELMISSGDLEGLTENGLTPRPDLFGKEDSLFSIRISLLATEDEGQLAQDAKHLLPEGWPSNLDTLCLAVLMAPYPPLDYDIEIIEQIIPEHCSNHERMLKEQRIANSLALGGVK